MTVYGHYIEYGLSCHAHIRSATFLLAYLPPPLSYFAPVPSSLCTYESTLNPSGSFCPASSSTSVSRILVSTCSDGSSVRTFFFREYFPRETRGPDEIRLLECFPPGHRVASIGQTPACISRPAPLPASRALDRTSARGNSVPYRNMPRHGKPPTDPHSNDRSCSKS